MPVQDLFAKTRQLLFKLFRKSRRAALTAVLVPLGAIGSQVSYADPPPQLPPGFPTDQLFCFRITDIERVPGDLENNAFKLNLEVLNWTYTEADALILSTNVGSTTTSGLVPQIAGASIDANGRGGAPGGGTDIGSASFDPRAIHSGRGRGDIPNALNDWGVDTATLSTTNVQFDIGTNGTPIPHRDLLFSGLGDPTSLVPGFGNDDLGDSAVDGGPTPYTNPGSGGGQPDPDGSGNVLDGFVIEVDDWDEGEIFSLNWFLAAEFEGSASLASLVAGDDLFPIGVSGAGNDFGFGVVNIARMAPGSNLPGAVFVGNSGMVQDDRTFYDTVYEIANPTEFAAEFGAAITGEFLNPADNVFGVDINTTLVPEPTSVLLAGMGLASVCVLRPKRSN